MNKKIWLIIGLVVLVAVGIYFPYQDNVEVPSKSPPVEDIPSDFWFRTSCKAACREFVNNPDNDAGPKWLAICYRECDLCASYIDNENFNWEEFRKKYPQCDFGLPMPDSIGLER